MLRVHPTLGLLVLACVLLVAVVIQAHAAVRSHQATVDRVLTDYAKVAAWNYRQRLEPQLADILEHLFHPLHDPQPNVVHASAPPMSRVLHTPHTEESCGFREVGTISDVVRLTLGTDQVTVLGEGISHIDARTIGTAVADHLRHGSLLSRTEALVGVDVGGEPHIAAYSRQLVRRDTLAYAVLIPTTGVAEAFRMPVSQGSLLPTPLVSGVPIDELLVAQVRGPDDRPVFQSAEEFPTEYSGFERIGDEASSLTLAIGLKPAAAQRLVIGGLPRSRLPLLLGLLIVATALMFVAFVQLRREHEIAAMRAAFVSSVSHELRTPLALQRVLLDTLKLGRAESDERRKWALDNIDRETDRLTNLVDNVLRFAQAGEGRLEVNPVPTALAGEISTIVDDYRPLASTAGATLCLGEIDRGLVAPVDRDALRQVLRNLLENAAKYGPKGQHVTIDLRQEQDDAVLTVTDEGPGILPGERERIWEPFQRGGDASESATGGSGIGLSVVRDIVALHGGEVRVEDGPSGGARFCVTFPRARRLDSTVGASVVAHPA